MLRETPSPDVVTLGLGRGQRRALEMGLAPQMVADVLARLIDWRKRNPHWMAAMF
jgi:hypothetical protein